jgi:hypothetical protein
MLDGHHSRSGHTFAVRGKYEVSLKSEISDRKVFKEHVDIAF